MIEKILFVTKISLGAYINVGSFRLNNCNGFAVKTLCFIPGSHKLLNMRVFLRSWRSYVHVEKESVSIADTKIARVASVDVVVLSYLTVRHAVF